MPAVWVGPSALSKCGLLTDYTIPFTVTTPNACLDGRKFGDYRFYYLPDIDKRRSMYDGVERVDYGYVYIPKPARAVCDYLVAIDKFGEKYITEAMCYYMSNTNGYVEPLRYEAYMRGVGTLLERFILKCMHMPWLTRRE